MPRPTRFRPLRLLVPIGLLAALWSVGWWTLAGLAERQFDGWIVREVGEGRRWTCPDRVVDGFPAALRLHCTRPTFRGEVAGHETDGVVDGLDVAVAVLHPASVTVTPRGPLVLRARDEAFLVALNWDALGLAVPFGLDGMPGGGTVAVTRLAVSGSVPGRGDLNLRIAKLDGHVAATPDVPADRRFAVTLLGVTLPTLDGLPGLDNGVTEAVGSGVLTAAASLSTPTVARLEAWRQAGGLLRLETLRFDTGSLSGTAGGNLALDDAHRPAGALDLSLVGFEPLARRLGIPVAGARLGGLLASVLGGGRPAAPAEPGALRLPLTLADGQVQLGPFPLGIRLSPLY